MIFRTALCDLLGIEYPILQSGMGGIAGPELVAEVSRAGALGILAGLNVPADELRRPTDPATIPDRTVRAAQGALNQFRERLGIPTRTERPDPVPDLVDDAIGVILDERVPVFSAALGTPDVAVIRRCFERGIKIVAMVATVKDARVAAGAGVDVIVAQGFEAGGHRSTGAKTASAENAATGTLALVPQIVDAVNVPVVAAGGIADGRGLAAALALGAAGILLGTRFVATRESMAEEFWKKALLESEADA